MRKEFTCKFCKKTFLFEASQAGGHAASCSMNPNLLINKEKHQKNTSTAMKLIAFRNKIKYEESPNLCKNCGKTLPYEKRMNKFCDHVCSATHSNKNRPAISDEQKLKTSKTIKKLWAAGVYDNIKYPTTKPNKGWSKHKKQERVHTECLHCGKLIEHRKSEKRKFHKECWLISGGGFRENSTIKHRSIYKGYQMDSGAEGNFAKLLDIANIKWIKNTTKYFEYTNTKGKQSKYYPDFYLEEYDMWVEIKGKFYAEKDPDLQLKLNSVKNIKMIFSNELLKCENDIKRLLFEVH